jgi:hypothetical protein
LISWSSGGTNELDSLTASLIAVIPVFMCVCGG